MRRGGCAGFRARTSRSYAHWLVLGLAAALSATSIGAFRVDPAHATADSWKTYLAPDAVCPGASRAGRPRAAQANTVACLINFARRQRGVRALRRAPVLNRASLGKAHAIRRCETFAHNPCGGDWTSVLRATGYRGALGENLYIADRRASTPRAAVLAWLASPPHRRNLFRPGWREQGLALMPLTRFGTHGDVSLWVSVLGGH